MSTKELFDLSGKTAVITGGGGLLGKKHAEALMEFGANCVLVDIDCNLIEKAVKELRQPNGPKVIGFQCDITKEAEIMGMQEQIKDALGSVDILINNAANNPKFEEISEHNESAKKRFETYPVEAWQADLEVGLKGSFLCSRIFGRDMAERKGGIILNIASDLGVIAPDQRIYREEGIPEDEQPTKPVTYSVVKTGLIGLTRYVATYWAEKGVRCNALVPGGVYTGQDEHFVKKLTNLIPMGRMATKDEYKAAVVFLCSDASAYMTGASVIMEGGRTCW